MSPLKQSDKSESDNGVSESVPQLVDSARLITVPNVFIPQALQQHTQSQVEAIIAHMNELKRRREELECQAQEEIDGIEGEHASTNVALSPKRPSKLRRMWKTMDALFEEADAVEQIYFVYKLASTGLRWISPSELTYIPEEEAATVIEVLRGRAAYIEGYKQYATHDIRVVLQCIKSSGGKICLLDRDE